MASGCTPCANIAGAKAATAHRSKEQEFIAEVFI
jgi:hypothetical protein